MNPQSSARTSLKSAGYVRDAILDLSDQLTTFKNRLCDHDPEAPGVIASLNMLSEMEELLLETLDELRQDEAGVYNRLMTMLKG